LISELYGTAVSQAAIAIRRGKKRILLKGRNMFTVNCKGVLQKVEEYQKYEILLFGLITVSVLNKLCYTYLLTYLLRGAESFLRS